MYSPYDRWLDKTTDAASVDEPLYSQEQQKVMHRAQRRRRYQKKFQSAPQVDPSVTTRVFAFHKRYVQEAPKTKREWQQLQKKLQRDEAMGARPMEVRVLRSRRIAYLVPARRMSARKSKQKKTTKGTQELPEHAKESAIPEKRDSMFDMYSRWLALRAVDRLVDFQEEENEKIRRQTGETNCCP